MKNKYIINAKFIFSGNFLIEADTKEEAEKIAKRNCKCDIEGGYYNQQKTDYILADKYEEMSEESIMEISKIVQIEPVDTTTTWSGQQLIYNYKEIEDEQ